MNETLDLFVPAYVDFDINKLPASPADVGKDGASGRNFCQFRGQPVMCGPRGLPGAKDQLFHQKSDGTFEDVSQKTGVNDESKYYGFSSVFVCLAFCFHSAGSPNPRLPGLQSLLPYHTS